MRGYPWYGGMGCSRIRDRSYSRIKDRTQSRGLLEQLFLHESDSYKRWRRETAVKLIGIAVRFFFATYKYVQNMLHVCFFEVGISMRVSLRIFCFQRYISKIYAELYMFIWFPYLACANTWPHGWASLPWAHGPGSGPGRAARCEVRGGAPDGTVLLNAPAQPPLRPPSHLAPRCAPRSWARPMGPW